eukprot:TRINITY_DN60187_c0_g1_i1.p1 TRINITY_DN60187_c0_g1~~TRINITY_DN60187_c0_g1_i1.p1  ORF type:complete len:102 (+),score=18.92 TRINITY_DN60187_c0_g1_i1:334-639(+)
MGLLRHEVSQDLGLASGHDPRELTPAHKQVKDAVQAHVQGLLSAGQWREYLQHELVAEEEALQDRSLGRSNKIHLDLAHARVRARGRGRTKPKKTGRARRR